MKKWLAILVLQVSVENWVNHLHRGEIRHADKSTEGHMQGITRYFEGDPSRKSVGVTAEDKKHAIGKGYSSKGITESQTGASKQSGKMGNIIKTLGSKLKKDIPLLTLFTTWPAKAEKYVCHNNTVSNWLSLKPHVVPILFSNESDLSQKVKAKGWTVLPVSRTGGGIPVLKQMFLDAMNTVDSYFYGYSNGDILFTDRLLNTLYTILTSDSVNTSVPVMIVGQRTNVQDVKVEEASTWKSIETIAKARGKLFTTYAEDFLYHNEELSMERYTWSCYRQKSLW